MADPATLPPLPWTTHRSDSLATVYDANERVILLLNGPGAVELAELFARAPGVREAADDALAFVRHALEFFNWSAFPHLQETVGLLRDKLAAALAKGDKP